jgi:phytoene desaturase (3,4-didehydrolycopene-forming)
MSFLSFCLVPLIFLIDVSFSFRPTPTLIDDHGALGRLNHHYGTALFSEKRVVVVGGGIGGLAVASRIASASRSKGTECKVTVLEKNSYVGGRCGSFQRQIDKVGIFRHERGPSLLLLPDVYRSLFQDCSSLDAEEFGLQMAQCIPAYRTFFEDGDSIEVGFPRQPSERMSDEESQSRSKMNKFEPDGAKKWDEYMKATSAFLDAGLSNFIEERLDLLSLPNFLRESLRDFAKVGVELEE